MKYACTSTYKLTCVPEVDDIVPESLYFPVVYIYMNGKGTVCDIRYICIT